MAKFNRIVGEITFGNGTYHHMESNGAIAVLKRRDSFVGASNKRLERTRHERLYS